MKKAANIFAHTDCLSEEMLIKYVAEKLTPAQKHEVEKHLLDCEMCSDAVDGLSRLGDKNRVSKITSELNEKIQNRAAQKKEVKIIFLQHYRTQLAVAASVVVLLGLVWFFRSNMSMNELDKESSEKIFADKFEPYQVAADSSESSLLGDLQPDPQREEAAADQILNAEEYKTADEKEAVAEEQMSIEGKNDDAKSTLVEKKPAFKVTITSPQGSESSTPSRDDIVVSDKAENAPKKSAPSVPPAAAGAAPVAKEELKRAESNQLAEKESKEPDELQAAQTKSNSGKYRAKKNKDDKDFSKNKSAEVPAEQASGDIEVMSNAAVSQEAANLNRHDTTSFSGIASLEADADNAMHKYEQKDFSGAAVDFETMLKKDPDNYQALFYSAVSYLSIGETDKAVVNLNKVLVKKEGELHDAARWYLSLAYIKKNDTQNARKNLQELQRNSKSRYQKEADETLKEMKK